MPTRIVEAQWLKKQKRWQIKVQADGIRRAFTSSIPGRAGKAEAHRKADEWLSSTLVGSTSLVPIVWDKWVASLNSADAITKAGTFWKRYISSVIGKKQIGDITEGDLQDIIDRAAKKGLAWKSLSNIRSILAGFIKWSRKNRFTTITTEDLDIPKNAPKGKKVILQPSDIIKMWSVKQTPYNNLFKLAVLTGLRPGELIGLQWQDVIDSRLHVQRAINYSGEITEGKNENAQRIIWLGEYEQNILQQQRIYLKKSGIISPWIFPKYDDQHPKQQAVTREWKTFCKYAGITTNVTPYGWRHTFVSINNEMPEGLKRRRVGHAMNMDAEGVYGQAVMGEDELAANYVKQKFDAIFSASPKPTL